MSHDMEKKKPIDVWLAIGGVVVTILLYLFGKTPAVVIILSVLLFALLIHPVWNFWWVGKSRWRQIFFIGLLAAVSCLIAYGAWPIIEPGNPPSAQQGSSFSLSQWLSPITTRIQNLPWGWIAISLAIGCLLAGWPLIRLLRGERKRATNKSKELQDRTAELESEKASLEGFIKTQCEWLRNIADEDAKDIGKRVFVNPSEVRYYLSGDLPQIDFDFTIFNGSVYSLSVAPTPEGDITCGKKPLIEAKRVTGFKNLAHGYESTFTLELRLSPTEAAFILKKQQSGEDVFYFGHLTIKVNGGDYYPNLTAKPLKLPTRVRGTGITERETFLKTQYESEIGEQQQRADIIGKLTFVLGMTQQVSKQFSLGGPVDKLALVTLNDAIGQALWACYDDQQFIVDGYYGGEPHNIPDSTDEQKKWVELHHHKLSKLIDEQRQEK